mgnify:FL=1
MPSMHSIAVVLGFRKTFICSAPSDAPDDPDFLYPSGFRSGACIVLRAKDVVQRTGDLPLALDLDHPPEIGNALPASRTFS